MRDLLKAMRGSKLVAKGKDERGNDLFHYLHPTGIVVEVVIDYKAMAAPPRVSLKTRP